MAYAPTLRVEMRVEIASEAAPDRQVNEDAGFTTGALVGVLDGVSVPDGIETGCGHGPAWYVERLAGHLTGGYEREPGAPLPDLLERAIAAVGDDHAGTCDTGHANTPASTVCLLRRHDDRVEHLVLADSPLVFDRGTGMQVITDDRFDRACSGMRERPLTAETVRQADRVRAVIAERQALTNTPGGYWIAAADPEAAHHAVTGVAPLTGPDRVRRAALLTDGASAAVDVFGLFGWRAAVDLMTSDGPQELIRRVRAAEEAGAPGSRYKRYDDATAALCRFDR